MISVIIPVYNVEPYLRKCLDSVINQTYRDLEILIIDDGSTDGSGSICDVYKQDDRVKVFHTENRGLSCARNFGLDKAKGEWIGFVDSDDWIEPDMYEVLINRALETGADVVECGWFEVYPNRIVKSKSEERIMSGEDATRALLQGKIRNAAWNKLWSKQCFETVRFPEGQLFEDHATTYRVYLNVKKVGTGGICKYHYRQREDSLSHTHDIKNLIDFWIVNRERYETLNTSDFNKDRPVLLRWCAFSAIRTWSYYADCSVAEREKYYGVVQQIHTFVRNHIPLFGYKGWDIRLRVGIFFPHYLNSFSLRMASVINRINKLMRA